MDSGEKFKDIETRLHSINRNLQKSFSAVKRDVNGLKEKNKEISDDIKNRISALESGFVKIHEFESSFESLNQKYRELNEEITKKENLKKELRQALKLKDSFESMEDELKKAVQLREEFQEMKSSVVSSSEFVMHENKIDAKLKKKTEDIADLKKEFQEIKQGFVDEEKFRMSISELREQINILRKDSVKNSVFREKFKYLDSGLRKVMSIIKKNPEISYKERQKISDIMRSQEREKGIIKSAWSGVVDFFTEEIEETEQEKSKKKRAEKKQEGDGFLKSFWKGIAGLFTEEEPEEWEEKEKKQKNNHEEKKQDNAKLIKYIFVIFAALIIAFLYFMGLFKNIISFIITYRYNILIGLIILAVIILLLERREK